MVPSGCPCTRPHQFEGRPPICNTSSSGVEPPLVGGFGLPNDILPFCSILNTGYPIFYLHLTKVLYIVLPSILGSSSWSIGEGIPFEFFLSDL